mgnify:CR=1 FL=1
MKYKRMALAACALLLLLSATNLSAVLTDEHPRYHQHLERPAYTPCADHGEDLLCSHLPLVLIDTGGAEIPGVPIRDGDGSRSNDTFTTPPTRRLCKAPSTFACEATPRAILISTAILSRR